MSAFHKFIATGFGSGYSPVAPGTMGTLVAFLMVGLLHFFEIPNRFSGLDIQLSVVILTIVFTLLGLVACNALEKQWGHDNQKIVVDEMVGYWISILFVPITWTNLILAFILFRILDIFKPWPINQAEKWPKAWGVMGDDILAGIGSLAILMVINIWI